MWEKAVPGAWCSPVPNASDGNYGSKQLSKLEYKLLGPTQPACGGLTRLEPGLEGLQGWSDSRLGTVLPYLSSTEYCPIYHGPPLRPLRFSTALLESKSHMIRCDAFLPLLHSTMLAYLVDSTSRAINIDGAMLVHIGLLSPP